MTAHSKGTAVGLSKRLDKLLEFHEDMARAVRLTIGALNGHATAAKQNGHTSVIEQAIELDDQRRTAKKAKRKKASGSPEAVQKRRRRSVKYLAGFDATHPRPSESGMSSMIARGYLRKKGDGYIRTSKPFHVDPEHPEVT